MGDSPLTELQLANYLHVAGTSILYYDHCVTFSEEYHYVWRNPATGASILFLVNRYYAFVANVVFLVSHVSHVQSTEVCSRLTLLSQIILLITQVIVAVIQFLKTFALYGRDKRVAATILVLASVLAALAIWAVANQESGIALQQGCHKQVSFDTAIRIAAAWEASFLYDLMIFIFTLVKTYQERRKHAQVLNSTSLMSLIVRDGAIYFAVMACSQCANTLTFYLLPSSLRGVLSSFSSSISVTMMSRFMLKLFRTAANRQNLTIAVGRATSTDGPIDNHFTTTLFTTRIALGEDSAYSDF